MDKMMPEDHLLQLALTNYDWLKIELQQKESIGTIVVHIQFIKHEPSYIGVYL